MTENRGGPRPNSGRKPAFGLSDQEMKRLLLAIRREGKKNHHGKTWQTKFAEHLYSDKQTIALPFFKMLTEKLFVTGSSSESTATKSPGPTIYLPKELPDNVAPIKKRISKK